MILASVVSEMRIRRPTGSPPAATAQSEPPVWQAKCGRFPLPTGQEQVPAEPLSTLFC